MKYTYAYKTSDGTRHEAAMEAASREAVFEELRRRGIKAIKVVASDGSKANGEVRGVRKRVVATLVAVAIVVVSVLVALLSKTSSELDSLSDKLLGGIASPRHQIYGDPVIMQGMKDGDLDAILPREGDRLLAWFAQPGTLMCPKDVKPQRLNAALMQRFETYAKNELSRDKDIPIVIGDSREVTELKQIVNGIRDEFRLYLANGNGTPHSFWRRLNERTAEEIRIYERTRRELENEKSQAVWEEKNEALRRIGLRTIIHIEETQKSNVPHLGNGTPIPGIMTTR